MMTFARGQMMTTFGKGTDDADLVPEYFRTFDLPYVEEEIVEGST